MQWEGVKTCGCDQPRSWSANVSLNCESCGAEFKLDDKDAASANGVQL